MADVAISALPTGSTPDGSELVPVVQGGGTVKITTQQIADLSPAPSGSDNTFAGFDNNGLLYTIPGWAYFTNTFGANVNLIQNLDDTSYTIHNFNDSLEAASNSPNSNYSKFNLQYQIDTNNAGFTMGTNGSLANIFNLGYSHQGKSNIGSLTVANSYSNIGNGTDAIDVGGYGGYFVFADFNDNVNLSKGLQGYIFQPHIHSLATFSTGGAFSNIFGDFTNCEVVCDGWNSFTASPIIGGVHTNNNLTCFNASPTVGTMQGNSGLQLVALNGSVQTLGTGGFSGIFYNTEIANLSQNSRGIFIGGQVTTGTAEWIGIDVSAGAINTTGPVRCIRANNGGNTSLTDFITLEIGGRSNLSSDLYLVSGQGQMYNNVIGGSLNVDNGVTPATITGTDVLGNNMAISVNTGLAGSTWTAASLVGLTTLGFVGVVQGDGTINGPISFCLNGFAYAANGPIQTINNFLAAGVPAGGTGAVGEHILFHGDMPAGLLPGTTGPGGTTAATWGVRVDDSASAGIENYLNRLAIGTSNKKVSGNALLEVNGGEISITSAGNGLGIKEQNGNAKLGQYPLTAGAATVPNSALTATSRVFVAVNIPGGTPGFLTVTNIIPGVSFDVISSSALDTSVISWLVIEGL